MFPRRAKRITRKTLSLRVKSIEATLNDEVLPRQALQYQELDQSWRSITAVKNPSVSCMDGSMA